MFKNLTVWPSLLSNRSKRALYSAWRCLVLPFPVLSCYHFHLLSVFFFTIINLCIDLDYFEDAINFLHAHESIESSKGIGVVGISKSAEIALLMATYLGDKVSAVVAMNGMPMLTGRYKYQGKDLLKGEGNEVLG